MEEKLIIRECCYNCKYYMSEYGNCQGNDPLIDSRIDVCHEYLQCMETPDSMFIKDMLTN